MKRFFVISGRKIISTEIGSKAWRNALSVKCPRPVAASDPKKVLHGMKMLFWKTFFKESACIKWSHCMAGRWTMPYAVKRSKVIA